MHAKRGAGPVRAQRHRHLNLYNIRTTVYPEIECPDPGSNRGPSDLQSDALPTELSRHLTPAFIPMLHCTVMVRHKAGPQQATSKSCNTAQHMRRDSFATGFASLICWHDLQHLSGPRFPSASSLLPLGLAKLEWIGPALQPPQHPLLLKVDCPYGRHCTLPQWPAVAAMSMIKHWLHFSICVCHPCAGAMLIFSVSFQS